MILGEVVAGVIRKIVKVTRPMTERITSSEIAKPVRRMHEIVMCILLALSQMTTLFYTIARIENNFCIQLCQIFLN